MKIEVEISDDMIKKSALKGTKISSYEIEGIARSIVMNKVKARIRKDIKDIDSLIEEVISEIDWSSIINERVQSYKTYNEYDL